MTADALRGHTDSSPLSTGVAITQFLAFVAVVEEHLILHALAWWLTSPAKHDLWKPADQDTLAHAAEDWIANLPKKSGGKFKFTLSTGHRAGFNPSDPDPLWLLKDLEKDHEPVRKPPEVDRTWIPYNDEEPLEFDCPTCGQRTDATRRGALHPCSCESLLIPTARLSFEAVLRCKHCGTVNQRSLHTLCADRVAVPSYVCPNCCGLLITSHPDHPRRLPLASPELKGNRKLRGHYTVPRFQEHMHLKNSHTFQQVDPDDIADLNDYEFQQQRMADQGFDGAHRDDKQLLTAKNAAAKEEMNAPTEEMPQTPDPRDFETLRATAVLQPPHLEIGDVVLFRRDRTILVSIAPPNIFRAPEKFPMPVYSMCRKHFKWVNKSAKSQDSGWWAVFSTEPLEHDVLVYLATESCENCNMGDGSLRGWGDVEDRLRAAVATEPQRCAICNERISSWANLCRACARRLMWQQFSDLGIEQPNVKGAAAAFQEKILRGRNRTAAQVSWEGAWLVANSIVASVVAEAGGHSGYIGNDGTGVWLIRNVPWLEKLLTRFWLYTHGETHERIAEYEGVNPSSIQDYLQRWSRAVKGVFDSLGQAINDEND